MKVVQKHIVPLYVEEGANDFAQKKLPKDAYWLSKPESQGVENKHLIPTLFGDPAILAKCEVKCGCDSKCGCDHKCSCDGGND